VRTALSHVSLSNTVDLFTGMKSAEALHASMRPVLIRRSTKASRYSMPADLYQMFGIPPSVMMRGGFFEIPSPFSTAT
jgi:hypothetical protein